MKLANRSKTYHHGDLKPDLIDAVLELLEDGGESSVSLRAIARRVGVSQTAPYSHFENKADLLASVVAAGFKRFASTMANEASTDPSAAQKRLAFGIGYVEFAVNNRALFRLMFSKASRKYFEQPEVRTEASASYKMLEDVMTQRNSKAQGRPSIPPSAMSVTSDPNFAAHRRDGRWLRCTLVTRHHADLLERHFNALVAMRRVRWATMLSSAHGLA